MSEMRRTPLYAVQHARGGRFVPFAGWEMPVQFTGLVAEHQAVRERVGLFDVSHMGELIVEGPEALTALQYVVTNDVSKLTDGKALYTVMCVEDGGIVDDLIVYREAADRYFLCVNASRRQADHEHIRKHLTRFRCKLTDVSDDWAQIAVQGPRADDVVAALTSHDVRSMAPFTWTDASVGGVEGVRVARTGYTGERGFELYCRSDGAEDLWLALEKAGGPHGLALCGLGARDTLRLEMKYPLYGNDIDLARNPLEAGLGWVVKLPKGEFVGSAALSDIKAKGPARKWVGFKMTERGIPRQGYPIWANGAEVGVVTSGTHSPSLSEGIGAGYVPAALA
ncbi:MAG TPA: glycine cleavage system aminomethyltransferase GcvT, partial [Myxococcota bacterium]|nr:glycine cleavage system aminomethyltransferase GcvT [Myxococcota bacterium]